MNDAVHAHIDFETRSAADLKALGIDLYSRHPTTDAWCLAFAFGDDEPELWVPGMPCPLRLRAHVEASGIVVAHNAAFELAIWNNVMVPRYGWPVLRPEQVRCTMAQAYSMALPGSLEKAAAAVGIEEQKDMAGSRLMMQMARPRSVAEDGTITWWDEPEKLARLYDYCKQDVRVEREMEKRLLPLSQQENALWLVDYAINQRGFHVDRPAIQAALQIVDAEKARLDADLRRVTGNFVGFCTETARLTAWIRDHGVDVAGVAKADVLDALATDGLPDAVRAALRIRQEAGKSSMAKLDKILSAISEDGRLRNTLQYHAASTGRWAGRRVQPHNFPRPRLKQKDIDRILDTLPDAVDNFGAPHVAAAIDNAYGAPLDVLPWCLRGIINAAPGKDLLGADYANIEGRALAWLAGEDWKLQAFREADAGIGPDIYLVAAKMIWGLDFTKDDPERQHGKVAELACGYGGGVGAFQTMAKTYLVKVDDTLANEIKQRWRDRHPATCSYWYDLEDAAIGAVGRSTVTMAGPPGRQVKFRHAGSFLWCQLPSGRVLCYPYPQIRQVMTPWGALKDALTYMTVPQPDDRKKGKIIYDASNRSDWARISTYGGKLSENVTQAVCRDFLAEALLRLDDAGASPVLHVHDEILIEVNEAAPAETLPAFERIVGQVPAWATGMPITAAGWRGKRYQKG